MPTGRDYLKEIQKFTTSQYWNSGVRITTGVMVPMLIMVHKDWLSEGIPFLWGALFVSLTDTPGPIHHRRNGMFAGIVLNALTVLITGFLYENHILLLIQVLVFSFFFSLLGIYGTRAGAVGTLALVVMLLNMSPMRDHQNFVQNALLTAGGGLWYTIFSILLFRLQPYRLVEQALGEHIIQIADYIKARAMFYQPGADIDTAFTSVMQEQVEVLKNQNQLRELIFKTRQFVGDASPKSRSIMMVFLESLDLFEETMYTYQDYKLLQQHTRHTEILQAFYTVIQQLAATLEHIGLSVQGGITVKKTPDYEKELTDLKRLIDEHKVNSSGAAVNQSLHALELTIENIRGIVNRLCKLVLYTQLRIDINPTLQDEEEEQRHAAHQTQTSKPLHVSLVLENFTLRSNNFRYASRLTVAMIMGYTVSAFFAVSHTYWVLLTITTILKPVYNVTRRRNIQRVIGTLGGVLVASLILYLVSNDVVLLGLLILCMLMAYSFLRVNYLGFVIFLTIYIIITFHFLNPVQFRNLIGERLIDTFIGSVIAALAARFIFPVWQHENIKNAMQKTLEANRNYFLAAWNQLTRTPDHTAYNTARNEAIVALTNLSDNFQQMLVEPGQSKRSTLIHQFVIASHALTSRISALSEKDIEKLPAESLPVWSKNIPHILDESIGNLDNEYALSPKPTFVIEPIKSATINPVSIIYSLARDLRNIIVKMAGSS